MRTAITRIIYPMAFVLATNLAGSSASAESERPDQSRHVHGVAELNLAFDENRVYIELATPAANVFGFEHAPNTRQQRQQMKTALDTLSDGERLFLFPSEAGCQLIEAEIDNPLEERADAAGQKEVQKEQRPAGDDDHANLTAEYRFECARPGHLDGLRVPMFGDFPGLDSLRLYYISEKAQGAATLSADQSSVRF